jgi:tetratricopeptide (TPR) repeat protein
MVLRAQGRWTEAESLQQVALGLYRKLLDRKHPQVLGSMTNLALILVDLRRLNEAELLLREVADAQRESLGPEHPRLAKSLTALASVRHRQSDHEEAMMLLEEAIAIVRNGLPPEHPDVAEPLMVLGKVLVEGAKADEAEALLREAWQIRQKSLPASHWSIAASASELGYCLLQLDRLDEAEPLLMESTIALLIQRGPGDRHSQDAVDRLLLWVEKTQRKSSNPVSRCSPGNPQIPPIRENLRRRNLLLLACHCPADLFLTHQNIGSEGSRRSRSPDQVERC